jgi:hypothetical protein
MTSLFYHVFGQEISNSLLGKLLSGNDSINLVLDIYRSNKTLSNDSLSKLITLSNKNYLQNDFTRKEKPDLELREIIFSDQIHRTKCYDLQSIEYRAVQKNDSILQIAFLKIIEKHPDLNVLTNSTYQMTFDLLLLHSVTTLQTNFFSDNFHKYSNAYSHNFNDFVNLKTLIDIYLNLKYEKQFFQTDYGKGKLPNDTFGLLPKLSDSDFKKVLSDLKLNNAIY